MPKKNKFYADPVIEGVSAMSVKLGATSAPGSTYSGTVKMSHLGALPNSDACRIASIVVPAGIQARINFMDGRSFVVYSADKPTKVKPSMLAPAHQWRDKADTTDLVTIDILNGFRFDGSGTTATYKLADLTFNVAVRMY